ncbi:SAC3 family protein B isoform X2 [Jatropha curcas]|uniref:SAC3 family protein B isoform X2 n=1 Tax=Jatropha curcas TaxID=180498 RepID=UPI0009D64E5B|nr:SAC3 family protein B isoform X2 [Jatropha curcas]
MTGFGKASGPAGPPSSQPRFGNFPRPPSPPQTLPFPHSVSARSPSPRDPVAIERVRSPPLVYDSLIYETSGLAEQSAGIPRRPGTLERVRSPPLSFDNNGRPSYPSVGAQRPTVSPPQWVNGTRSFSKLDELTNLRPSAVTSFVASRNSGNSFTAKFSRFQDLKRSRSPPSYASSEDISRNSSRTFLQRPVLSPSALDNQQKFPNDYPNPLVRQQQSSDLPHAGSYDNPRSFINEVADVPVPTQSRSPPRPATNEVLQKESQRPSTSPPRLDVRSNFPSSASDFQIPQRTFPSANNTALEPAPNRITNYSVAKRTRSPPLPTADKVIQDDTEREMQAKAKRLARFKDELSRSVENRPDFAEQKTSIGRLEQSKAERQQFIGRHSTVSGAGGDFTDGNISSDFEGLETSSIIVGLCPDMCPESEREERERKGDLDQYERLDGDRNQTNKFLAVKKYNRTAEREENLIRPMPVLQKTIDYLLNLLDQPYDDRFLGIYNFLWDRMRAIRMDLRMQHIFNQEAITMLEQMIRLHIIAMHELCEYTKGEGFSEGFDAHLNIEQMNKTSVDLFQMYDDHRKKGVTFPTEKEFRGYYALLKLDKHPGYKVEPAELSLDLANMSPEIRQTQDVLFARDVARACRTGNFVAFFRLARKATYLQACLIHAHFAKLRTHALASLHSGLQNNQGLPVAHVAKWLAMEEEDIGSLLEYHGFSMKEFEEPYMVKEGPFLNGDQDYPTKRSKLVQLKKSRKIVDNVSPTSQVVALPVQVSKEIQQPMIDKPEKNVVPSTFVNSKNSIHGTDEEMAVSEVASSPKIVKQVQPIIGKSTIGLLNEDNHQAGDAFISPWGFPMVHGSPVSPPAKLKDVDKSNDDVLFDISAEKNMSSAMEVIAPQLVSRTALQERSPSAKNDAMENTIPQVLISNESKDEEHPDINQEKENEELMENYEDEEITQAKLKLIIRLWKRRSSRQRELRERRQIIANAALNSLPLGPPIQKAKDQLSSASEFDIEHILRERYKKHEQSWSRLNVSDVTADILGKRNPGAGCLCWKIVLCCQMNHQERDKMGQRNEVLNVGAGPWLLSKILPSKKDDDDNDDLIVSSSGISIWKKWVPSQHSDDLTCCLSVVRNVNFDGLNGTLDGASAILFLVSESIPLNAQKVQLQNLLLSIPSGSCLPLLVLCGSYDKEVSDPSSTIVFELGLHDIDKSRVSSTSVVFLIGDQERESLDGFFSDVRLREGLQWLASESPLQPDIHRIKTRDLILTHLTPSLDSLEKASDHEVGPNHCISAFNEALDWSMGEIAAAAQSRPISWPCPEIALLPDSSEEHMVVNWYLPSIGWSSAARIEPFLFAVRECKLPIFPDAISWSDKGAKSGDEIENLRSELENCLISYLTQSSGMMTFNLAIKEAHVMLQKSARLELDDSIYYIVPKWISIFRRIFNWRLARLSNAAFSSAYVLRQHHVNPTLRILDDKLGLEGNVSLPHLSQPSLDEIIVGCAPPVQIRGQPQVEVFQSPPRIEGDVEAATNENDLMEDERTTELVTNHVDHVTTRLNFAGADIMVGSRTTKEADKLSKLLEQCNIVQTSIDEKLYLYF